MTDIPESQGPTLPLEPTKPSKGEPKLVMRKRRSALANKVLVPDLVPPITEDINPKVIEAIELLVNGDVTSITAAAQSSGISKQALAQALKRDNVRRYLDKALRDRLGLASISALRTVMDLSDQADSEYVRLEAAKDLLNRAGVGTEHTASGAEVSIKIDLG